MVGAGLGGLGSVLLEHLLSVVEGASELDLLIVEDLSDLGLHADNLRELLAHLLDESWENGGEELADLDIEVLAGVAGTTTENATDNISTTVVVWNTSIGNGEGEETNVISNDTVGSINSINIVLSVLVSVLASLGNLLDLLEERVENIGIVVGSLILKDRDETLETHTSIDVLGRESLQGAILLAIVLHENVVPDLKHVWIIHVDEVGSVAATDSVVVDLRARSTWSSLTHFPEVVGHVTWQDMILSDTDGQPQVLGLKIWLEAVLGITLEVGDIETVLLNAINLGQKLPGHLDGLLLEVVTERPVTQHLEHCLSQVSIQFSLNKRETYVVVRVLSDIIQILQTSSVQT